MALLPKRCIEWLKPYAKKNSVRFVAQEVGGSGIPHVALGMNFGDRVDQFYQQFCQEVGSYILTLTASHQVQRFFERHELRLTQPEQKKLRLKWKSLGVAFASLPLLAASDYSAMYMRNYLTSKTFKTHNFVDLVGLGASTSQPETDEKRQDRYAFERKQLQTVACAMGTGVLTGAAGAGWAFHHMKQGSALPRLLEQSFSLPFLKDEKTKGPLKTSLYNLLRFKDGTMSNITALQVFASFGAFGYSGLILGARSPVEQFEAWVKFGWYGLANMVFPKLLSKRMEKSISEWAGADKDAQKVYSFLTETVTGAVLYAMPPTLACLLTRRKRVDQFHASLSNSVAAPDDKTQHRSVRVPPESAPLPRPSYHSSSMVLSSAHRQGRTHVFQ
jgi:hypothetical protein